MVSKPLPLEDRSRIESCLDTVIEKGILLLLVFAPLPMGSVQKWSYSLMEIAVFIVLGAWLLKMSIERRILLQKNPLLLFFIAITAVVIFQISPLPMRLVGLISPETADIYRSFAGAPDGVWRTISISPHNTREELFKLLSYMSVFLVISNHHRSEAQIRGILYTIVLMGTFIALFAVLQKIFWNGRLFWFYPLDPGLNSNALRIWGPYINHNHFAGYMEMAIPVGAGLMLYKLSGIRMLPGLSFGRRLVKLSESREMIPVTLLSLALLAMISTLFFSLSRGGISGFTLSMIFFLVMTRRSGLLKRGRGAITVVLLAVLLLTAMAGWERTEERFRETGKIEKIKRFDVWSDAVQIAGAFPLTGTGLGTFRNIYPKYQSANPQLFFTNAENDYLEMFVETGVAGFSVMAAAVFTFFYSIINGWRKRRDPFVKAVAMGGISSCVAIALHSFVDFNTHIPANSLLLAVIAATTHAAVFNLSGRGRDFR